MTALQAGIIFLVGEPVIGNRGPGVPNLMPEGPVDAIAGAAQNGPIRFVSAGDTPLNKTVEIFYYTAVEADISAAIELKGAE